MEKKEYLKEQIQHVDIASFDGTKLIDSMREMSFSSRDTANAADIFNMMLEKEG